VEQKSEESLVALGDSADVQRIYAEASQQTQDECSRILAEAMETIRNDQVGSSDAGEEATGTE
jgi:hypothetical protein